jgi:pimeloyl-ACP methyl ester carboxylesterase
MPGTDRPLIALLDGAGAAPRRELVLFVGGLSGNDRQWDGVIPLLRAACEVDVGYGPGALTHPALRGTRPTVVRLARAIAEQLRARPERSTVLVSHSVGAFIALAIAREIPAAVRSVVIVNGGLTSVGRFIDSPLRQLALHPRECLGFMRLFAMVSVPLPRAAKRAIARNRSLSRLLVGHLVSDGALATDERRSSLLENAGSGRVLRLLEDNRHHWPEFAGYAGEIEVPCVFVVGDRDPMTTIEDTDEMAAMLPQAQIEILRGIGHAAPLEAPELVAETICRQLPARDEPHEG